MNSLIKHKFLAKLSIPLFSAYQEKWLELLMLSIEKDSEILHIFTS